MCYKATTGKFKSMRRQRVAAGPILLFSLHVVGFFGRIVCKEYQRTWCTAVKIAYIQCIYITHRSSIFVSFFVDLHDRVCNINTQRAAYWCWLVIGTNFGLICNMGQMIVCGIIGKGTCRKL